MELNKTSLYKQILYFIMIAGSLAYVLGGDAFEKLFNLVVILTSLGILLMFTLISRQVFIKTPLGFKVILGLIVWMTMMTLIQNSVSEWLPTVARYFLFLLVFTISYMLALDGSVDEVVVERILIGCLLFGAFSGAVELLTGNVRFVNGAYRVAGNFNHHHLGYALYMFVPLVYLGHKLLENFSIKLLLIWLFGFSMFAMSHSRALMVFLIASFAFTLFFWQESYKRKVVMLGVGMAVLFLLYNVVLHTELFPRLRDLLVVDELDPSTLYRIFVYEASTGQMSIFAKLFGIGAGGFNEFFYSATGITGTAAHNDYLLVYVEGGIFSLVAYLVFQIVMLKYFYNVSLVTKSPGYALKASFSLFLFMEIFGFLLNAHYFYQSEVMLCLILGVALGERKRELIDG